MHRKQIEQILALLRYFRRRMLAYDILMWIQGHLWVPVLAMLAVQLVGRFWPVKDLLIYTLIPAALFLLITMIFIGIVPKSNLSVAWRVDQDLHLKERISSVIAFEAFGPQVSPDTKGLFEKQREDALNALKNANPRLSFRFLPSHQRLLTTLLLIAASIALALIPNPMDAILKSREAVVQAAEEQAEEIEDLIEEIDSSEELSEKAKAALLRELEALAVQLRENQGDQAEALEDISRLEQALLERLDPDAEFKQSALNSISEQLAVLAKQNSDPSESPADLDEALESLAEQIGDMSESDRQQLSQNLQKLASQAARAGAASLAESLAAMSQAAQTGSVEGAHQAGEQAKQNLRESLGELSDQQGLEAALGQLQDIRQAISQAGQLGSIAQGPSSGQQGQGPGQGQNSSSGQGQGNNPGSGGGSNANNLPPGTGSGQVQTPRGTDGNGTAGLLEDQVFAPWERLQGENDPLSISGQDTGQGQTQVNEQDQPLPGANIPSIIPYQDVFRIYRDSAYQTVEQSYIPPSLKAYILEYFSQLEP